MTGIPVARANARNDVDPCLVVDGRETTAGGDRIGLRIDRTDLGRVRAQRCAGSGATSDSWMLPASGSM